MIEVGPVASASARAWISWVQPAVAELRCQPAPSFCLPASAVAGVDDYLGRWKLVTVDDSVAFRWRAEVDGDELVHVTNAFRNLDLRMAEEVRKGARVAEPVEGRSFFLVLVHSLLHALALEGPTRAAFADQLRGSWPAAAEAS